MCTCLASATSGFYFGRNLDLEYGFNEVVVIMPRYAPCRLRHTEDLPEHAGFIGMASKVGDTPLFAEAMNEHGLGIAGLYFPGNAVYAQPKTQLLKEEVESHKDSIDIAPFELIPWILAQCSTLSEVRSLLRRTRIIAEAYSEDFPLAPLHWMISSREGSIVLESCSRDGFMIYENPFNVLTNNPPFPFHEQNMRLYAGLSPKNPTASDDGLNALLKPFGQGFGALGLPGDASPSSRFVRAAFMLSTSQAAPDEDSQVKQFFHILDSVAMSRGSVLTEEGLCDITRYSCCMSAETLNFYYKTYDNYQINCVRLKAALELESPQFFELAEGGSIRYQN